MDQWLNTPKAVISTSTKIEKHKFRKSIYRVNLNITFGNLAAINEYHKALKTINLTQHNLNDQERTQLQKQFSIGDDRAKIILTLLNIISGFDKAMVEDIVKLFHTNTMDSSEANSLRKALLNKTLYKPKQLTLCERLDNFYENYPSL